jgi:hypothetical protein
MACADPKTRFCSYVDQERLPMINPISELVALFRASAAKLNQGVYVYSIVPISTDLSRVNTIAIFNEIEGVTVIVSEFEAIKAKLPILFRVAWITLTKPYNPRVAQLSQALRELGLSCNIVAAVYHNHLFVPVDVAAEAMERLRQAERMGAAF